MISEVTNEDCMELMKRYPDRFFDVAIVDPPYGIGCNWKKNKNGQVYPDTSYLNQTIPDKDYFHELFRVCKNQIIWGYNYFTDVLGATNYLIIWDKCCGNNKVMKYSKCEIAYTSFHVPANIVRVPWDGYRMGRETHIPKIHPHQKPIQLYEWLLDNYAKNGDSILDTHLGSGSSRIAAYERGFDFVGCEIDSYYYQAEEKRFADYKLLIDSKLPFID